LNNGHTLNSRLNKKMLLPLFLLCLSALIISCGEDLKSEELTVIDPAYLTSSADPTVLTSTTYPPVLYPIQIEDEFIIKVGELFAAYENVNWESVFPLAAKFSISNPEIIEGEGTICTIAESAFSVLAESPGSCSLKYPSTNGGSEGFVFLTITVIEG